MKKTLTILLIASAMLIGCATSKNPNDPYEHYNRAIFKTNAVVDKFVIRPVAVSYTYVVPNPIRGAITNFNTNLHDFISIANDILQADGKNTLDTSVRITVNSTIGILGLFDVASWMGFPEYNNTFGKTLRAWGWQHSSFFLIPFFGPGTVRDQLGLIPDTAFNPTLWALQDYGPNWRVDTATGWWIAGGVYGLNLLNIRSQYLDADDIIAQSLDPYATMRDIYLQSTNNYIYESVLISTSDNDNIDDILMDDESNNTKFKQEKTAIESINQGKHFEETQ